MSQVAKQAWEKVREVRPVAVKEEIGEKVPDYRVTCTTCGNIVCDPEVLRCPRCFKPLFQGVTCDGKCKNCQTKTEKCGSC